MRIPLLIALAMVCHVLSAQKPEDSLLSVSINSKAINELSSRAAALNRQLDISSEAFVRGQTKLWAVVNQKMAKADSAFAGGLFNSGQTNALLNKITGEKSAGNAALSGAYLPYVDSIGGMLRYLQQPVVLKSLSMLQQLQVQQAADNFNILIAKFNDVATLKDYISSRQAAFSSFLTTHQQLAGSLQGQFRQLTADSYTYAERVRGFKEELNDPDKLMKDALKVLSALPAFNSFMQTHSQLAGLLGVPVNYGSPEAVAGMQTKDQVAQLIATQAGLKQITADADPLQGKAEAAGASLDTYKNRLSQLGPSGTDVTIPDFQPPTQKTKTFLRRLQYGVNFQVSRTSTYYPNVADLGLSLGYLLPKGNVAGVGISYRLGLGSGWNDIAFSNQGLGFRSFLDIRLKSGLFASGGFEYNHNSPFANFQQIRSLSTWTSSGLIGISKSIAVKSPVFKNTKLSLLWDFLSYQQVPRTQPLLFRVGYSF